MARELFFWLFVTKMRGRRDDDVRLRRLLSANAAGAESGGHPEVVNDFVDIAVPYLTMTTADGDA